MKFLLRTFCKNFINSLFKFRRWSQHLHKMREELLVYYIFYNVLAISTHPKVRQELCFLSFYYYSISLFLDILKSSLKGLFQSTFSTVNTILTFMQILTRVFLTQSLFGFLVHPLCRQLKLTLRYPILLGIPY